ncbi:MAG TPA: ArsI/CadI family heavy metal resistance metalloenzyme [Pyrinomonadaceae bacterium]|jgi:catechol 2,3-dioxygenase-like lactoylglutathione lyase family enzyme
MLENNVKTLKPHISINVRNIEESVGFYRKLFGIEPVKFIKGNAAEHAPLRESSIVENEKPRIGYAKFDVQNPPLNFVLNEVPYATGGGLSHLGIQVETTGDVLKTRDRWIAEGLVTADEMQVDCCYALQDKTWARDPDGNEWEVFTMLENTEGKDNSCACGVKVETEELLSSDCCAKTANPININRSAQTCC